VNEGAGHQWVGAALKQAYQMVTEGVCRDRGFSWARFVLDEGGAVAGRRVDARGNRWDGIDYYRSYRAGVAQAK
jgi:hypothetical protein